MKNKNDNIEKLVQIFLVFGLILVIFNQFQLFTINPSNNVVTGISLVGASEIIPVGVPEVYGKELGISYDFVNSNNPQLADQTINIMGNIDRSIVLTGDDLKRYVDIVSDISCEYCCGAMSIIFTEDDVKKVDAQIEVAIKSGKLTQGEAKQYKRMAGDAACGCAHSFAMRGLAKYLITEHGDEFSDEEIMSELAKWKVLYFPAQMTAKAEVMKERGIEFSYVNLGSNKYRDIEKGAVSGSGMVGGC